MNFRLIAEQWDRIGQFYAAFPAGQATASAALQRLNRFQASNRFYAANRELGRALKIEFVLQYMSEPQLRAKVRRGPGRSDGWPPRRTSRLTPICCVMLSVPWLGRCARPGSRRRRSPSGSRARRLRRRLAARLASGPAVLARRAASHTPANGSSTRGGRSPGASRIRARNHSTSGPFSGLFAGGGEILR